MRVAHLTLDDFRNYRTADVPLVAGPNLFVGRNGQGKTNLVESIVYLSTLASHRTTQEKALIRDGADAAVVRARLTHAEREVLVELQLNRASANRAQVNRSPLKPRDLPRYVSSVVFAPEDLALVRGEPGVRRRFLDTLLVQRSPRLAGVLADYDRVLRQRNSLLKSARAGRSENLLSTLEVWDERLTAFGTEIVRERCALVDALLPEVRRAYRAVSGADHPVSLSPRLSVLGAGDDEEGGADAGAVVAGTDVAAAFGTALHRVRRAELERGITLVGPHRDDVLFALNGLPAKGYASHGESWSFALALRIASAELLRAESPLGDPVLVLDDVFAELDAARRRSLAEAVHDYEQVLVTAAVEEDVPEGLAAHTVRIEAGRIVPAPVEEPGPVADPRVADPVATDAAAGPADAAESGG